MILGGIILMYNFSIMAQNDFGTKTEENSEDSTIVDVYLNFGTTYYWRGVDVYSNKFAFDDKNEGVFNDAFSVMPEITLYTPIPGLTLDLWGAFALSERSGGEDIEAPLVGLEGKDELNLTIDYSYNNWLGDFSGGAILYIYPAVGGTYPELYLGYHAPVLLSPGVNVYFADNNLSDGVGSAYVYTSVDISHEFEVSQFTFTPSLLAGFWRYPYLGSDEDDLIHLDLDLAGSYNIWDGLSISLSVLFGFRFFPEEAKQVADRESEGQQVDQPLFKTVISFGLAYSF